VLPVLLFARGPGISVSGVIRRTGRTTAAAGTSGEGLFELPLSLLLCLPLVVPGVDAPGHRFDSEERIIVGNPDHLVLDATRESFVELMAESRVTPVRKTGQGVESEDIGRNPVACFHTTETDAILRITNRIVRTEVGGELLDEARKIVVPRRNLGIVEVRRKPLLSDTPEIRDDEVDLVVISGKVLSTLSEVEITLGKEKRKFVRVGTIEGVGVPEVRLGGARRSGIPDKNGHGLRELPEGVPH
jgi:hypothetical protein